MRNGLGAWLYQQLPGHSQKYSFVLMMFWLKAWRAGKDTPLLFPSAAVGKITTDVFEAELGKKFPSESGDVTQDKFLRALRVSEPEITEFVEVPHQ